jgi:hypothetical protein
MPLASIIEDPLSWDASIKAASLLTPRGRVTVDWPRVPSSKVDERREGFNFS